MALEEWRGLKRRPTWLKVEKLGPLITFGPFRLVPEQLLLLEGEHSVPLGTRAMQVLIALVERAGEVVGKNEIAKRVWPETFVEGSNLRVHIVALRKALRDGQGGARYIATIPGRGYSFVAPIERRTEPPVGVSRQAAGDHRPPLPPLLTRIFGRADTLAALGTDLPRARLLTLVGPGGIGKTTTALALARNLTSAYRDGAYLVDLAPIGSGQLVASALAAVLGLASESDAAPTVLAFLRHRQMLLILDGCEHVIEAAASLAEQIFSNAPDVHILATSREPLRVTGERVHRLGPLETPAQSAGLTAEAAMRFPGIQLFVERASLHLGGYALTDADAPFAAEICRQLDGIALAIELAASRLSAFGIAELAAHLDDRFRLLTGGRRTALPRHQTLAATLDWSYGLLSEGARRLLRLLSVIVGDFTLHTATAMFEHAAEVQVLTDLPELISKSLISTTARAGLTRYRLLDTTRLYGLQKLRQTKELSAAKRLHATHLLALLDPAERDGEVMPQGEWMATYASQLDNLRAALHWAGAEEDDPAMLVFLTANAVPLWVQLSLTGECRDHVERALDVIGRVGSGASVTRARMQLSAALGWALMYAAGRSREIDPAWTTALHLAEELGDVSFQLRALWGLWIGRINVGDWAVGLAIAKRLLKAVKHSSDEFDRITAERLFATTLHYRGKQRSARAYMERMFERYDAVGPLPRVIRFQIDPKIPAQYFQARILWLLGFFDQARRMVEVNVEAGLAFGHALSFSSVLGQGACPIAFYTGDWTIARRYADMLLEHAEQHRLGLWHDWAMGFKGLLAIQGGEVEPGIQMLRAAFQRAGEASLLPRYMILRGEWAASLGLAGERAAGLETIEDLIDRCLRSEECWYVPEALRIQGELILAAGSAQALSEAEPVLLRADTMARKQGARAWRLRAGISLARLYRTQGRKDEARSALSSLVAGFSDGLVTQDLQTARALLSSG